MADFVIIWALSLEGNVATRRQAMGLAAEIQQKLSHQSEIIPVIVKKPEAALTLPSNTIVTWQNELSAKEFFKIETIDGKTLAELPQPDFVVSCRPEVAAVALAAKNTLGATLVHIQDPNDKSGTYNFDRSQFDLIVKQAQEAVTGPNVITSLVPIHDLTPKKLAAFRAEGLAHFPKYENERATIVLIGGSDENVSLDAKDFSDFGADIAKFSQGAGDVIVLSSRRTTDAQKEAFIAKTSGYANILFDPPGLSYNMTLGIGTSFLFDGGSGSMGAEALFTGMPTSYFSYRSKLDAHPQIKVWDILGVTQNLFTPPEQIGVINEASKVAKNIILELGLPAKKNLMTARAP